MNLSDIRIVITIIILAFLLFYLYNNLLKKEEPATNTDGFLISPTYAENVTGNKLINARYVLTNDGDTFRLTINGKEERVRLLMVDTPEMNYEDNDPMPYAPEAKEFTMGLLENAKKIEVLYDNGPKTDNYGRLLAYVFVDDVLLQERLLQEGFAAVRFIHEPNNTLEEDFKKIEDQAKLKQINIWSHANYLQNDGFHPDVVAE
ncbi:thermonuclease family protein [Ureibacillus acetophenoni]|uniref:Endonuclease YncB( thermonuclease family) n=1 Tax=Ureibacillus acetophenoni TaxID=614649 RepID=A0A285U4D1_9BACL|nr:thermonuclease family protein [Ureibacillus acetophenoni]SOC35131.1 endonuclease YncB(thermonuclease family) [Ureibacillus acetophenoni]